MLTVVDQAGYLHMIPRERLVSISMLQPEPPGEAINALGQRVATGDPAGTKMKLVISYETTTPQLGQLWFFFTDDAAILQIKTALRNWAVNDGPNQLVIDAGRSTPAKPETTQAISLHDES